jgi:hypothetical protein
VNIDSETSQKADSEAVQPVSDRCAMQDLNLLDFTFNDVKRKHVSFVPVQDLHQ